MSHVFSRWDIFHFFFVYSEVTSGWGTILLEISFWLCHFRSWWILWTPSHLVYFWSPYFRRVKFVFPNVIEVGIWGGNWDRSNQTSSHFLWDCWRKMPCVGILSIIITLIIICLTKWLRYGIGRQRGERVLIFFARMTSFHTLYFWAYPFPWSLVHNMLHSTFLFWNGRSGLSESEITFLKEVLFLLCSFLLYNCAILPRR